MKKWIVSFFDSAHGYADWTLVNAINIDDAKKTFLGSVDYDGFIIMKVSDVEK